MDTATTVETTQAIEGEESMHTIEPLHQRERHDTTHQLNPIDIDYAQPNDLADAAIVYSRSFLHSIWNEDTPPIQALRQFCEQAMNRDTRILVAKRNNEVVGGCISARLCHYPEMVSSIPHKYSDSRYVADLFVDPDYQSFGIGSTLLRATEQLAASKLHDSVTLRTHHQDSKLHRFYEKAGYHVIGQMTPDDGSVSRVIFAKRVFHYMQPTASLN